MVREPEQRVQYALHESYSKLPAMFDRGCWSVYVLRSGATCGARANSSSELGACHAGRLQDSERGDAGAAAAAAAAPAQRTALGGESGTAEIILGIERGSLHGRRAGHATIGIHVAGFRREGSYRAPVSAIARAGVLRFRCFICHGNQLSGSEDDAVGALAQTLVDSTGKFDGGEPGGIWIHAGTSRAEMMHRIARRRLARKDAQIAARKSQ